MSDTRTITITDTPLVPHGWPDQELENRLLEWADAHDLANVVITVTRELPVAP